MIFYDIHLNLHHQRVDCVCLCVTEIGNFTIQMVEILIKIKNYLTYSFAFTVVQIASSVYFLPTRTKTSRNKCAVSVNQITTEQIDSSSK